MPPTAIHSEIQAVWDEHEDETYRRDQSHWRSVGRWSDEQWEKIGAVTFQRVGELYRLAGRTYPSDPGPVLLEWGPGGGSNLYRFAEHTRIMYGVDISQKNLDESARVLADFDTVDYRPILLDGPPNTVTSAVSDPVDLAISTSVFQHFPSKEYGIEVLRTLRSMLAPDGLAYIQIRFDNGNPAFLPKTIAEYRAHHITATSYDLSEFWDHCVAAGFAPLKIGDINTKANYAGFYLAVRHD